MTPPILFYDGECGLCDGTVRWCLRHDRRGELRFAPLQGATYAALQDDRKPTTLETLVLSDDEGLHFRSDAAIRLLRRFGGQWALLGLVVWAIPRPLRDASYRWLARHRRRTFGGPERCRLPTTTDRRRLLP